MQNVYHKVTKNMKFNLLLLIYILTSTDKNFTSIPFRLNYIYVLEVVIL